MARRKSYRNLIQKVMYNRVLWPVFYQITLKKVVGMAGVEPARLAAHDPKSCLSANSSTSPRQNAEKFYHFL